MHGMPCKRVMVMHMIPPHVLFKVLGVHAGRPGLPILDQGGDLGSPSCHAVLVPRSIASGNRRPNTVLIIALFFWNHCDLAHRFPVHYITQ